MSEQTNDKANCRAGNRRHRMGRRARLTLAAITLVGIGAVLGAGASVQAARMGAWHGMGHGTGRHSAPPATEEQALERALDGAAWVLGRIDASSDQQTRVNAIVTSLVGELHPLRDEHEARRRQLITELARPRVDAEALEGIRAQTVASVDAASRSIVEAVVDMSEVLTVEQREALAAMIARHRH